MRIVILNSGSRGDIQPYIALGVGLRQAGYEVRIVVQDTFQQLVSSYGLDFAPIERFEERAWNAQEWGALQQAGGRLVGTLRHLLQISRLAEQAMEQVLINSWEACQDADAILCGSLGYAGPHIAERLDIPYCWVPIQPSSRTRVFPHWMAPHRPRLGRQYNLVSHVIAEQLFWQLIQRPVNRWRQNILRLPRFRGRTPYFFARDRPDPVLFGFSSVVVPKPPDWSERMHITGYWFLDQPADWHPPEDLVHFLRAGDPPVFIGFGSMLDSDPEWFIDLVSGTLARIGRRGIVLVNSLDSPRAKLRDDIYLFNSIPYDWLFPQVAAVVHHGGAGTTAAGLRAGIPTVIVPFFADQLFWGARVADLGAEPPPIPRRELTIDRLAAALDQALTDQSIRSRVAALGQRIRSENGVTNAVQLVQAYLGRAHHPSK